MSQHLPPESSASLIRAQELCAIAARPAPHPPDLHAVIVQAPKCDHPRLYPGAELPSLPEALRRKPLINAFFVPLLPAAKITYVGDANLLGAFRDLSRTALAAMRENFPDMDAHVQKVLHAGVPWDAEHILADCCLLHLRNVICDDERRKSLLERWLWGDTLETARVPFCTEDRGVWSQANPGVAVPDDAPDVTVFHLDLFTVCADALRMLIRRMRLIPPHGTTGADSLSTKQGALNADAMHHAPTTIGQESEPRQEDKPPPPIIEQPKPRWDTKEGTLFYGTTVCRILKKRSGTNVEPVFDAFEGKKWKGTVPCPDPKTIEDVIKILTYGHTNTSMIKFHQVTNEIGWKEKLPRE
jgi:hypothetical protein